MQKLNEFIKLHADMPPKKTDQAARSGSEMEIGHRVGSAGTTVRDRLNQQLSLSLSLSHLWTIFIVHSTSIQHSQFSLLTPGSISNPGVCLFLFWQLPLKNKKPVQLSHSFPQLNDTTHHYDLIPAPLVSLTSTTQHKHLSEYGGQQHKQQLSSGRKERWL